ncbi:MAG TPA: DinB family protein [Candidatus Sulfotelmatobacter sp.]|nr:DinB family protein [Candidatus Sulfotelmatobacter sp.]
MNQCLRVAMLCVVVAASLRSATAQAGKLNLLDVPEFVRDWQISKQFTMEVAQAMPAEYYGFKATPEEMSFGEQIVHIAGANVFRFKQIIGIKPPFDFDPAKPGPTDKETSLKLLEQSFDYVLDVLPKITPEQLQRTWNIPSWKGRTQPDGRAMIMNMFVHTAHHRAQCEVYLRLKGIKPPDYTF